MILDIPPKVGAYSRREIADVVEKELRELCNSIETWIDRDILRKGYDSPMQTYEIRDLIARCMAEKGIRPSDG
jgi:hypothetical protein